MLNLAAKAISLAANSFLWQMASQGKIPVLCFYGGASKGILKFANTAEQMAVEAGKYAQTAAHHAFILYPELREK